MIPHIDIKAEGRDMDMGMDIGGWKQSTAQVPHGPRDQELVCKMQSPHINISFHCNGMQIPGLKTFAICPLSCTPLRNAPCI